MYKNIRVDCCNSDLLFRIHVQTPFLYDISTKREMDKNNKYGKWITLKYTSNMSTYSWILNWKLEGLTIPMIADSYYMYDLINKISCNAEKVRYWKEVYTYKPTRDGLGLLRNNGQGKRHQDFKMWFDTPVYLPDKSICCLVRYSRSREDGMVLDTQCYEREKVVSTTYSLFWIRNECDYEVVRTQCLSSHQYSGYEEVISRGFKELASKYLELIDNAMEGAEDTEDIPLMVDKLFYVENVDYLVCEYNPFLYECETYDEKCRF